MEKKLYVLIRKDLDPVYGCVQGGHAVAQWLLDNRESQTWNNGYLIYLHVDDIEKWIFKLQSKELNFSVFKEPDLGNKITTIAVEHNGSLFRNLRTVGR